MTITAELNVKQVQLRLMLYTVYRKYISFLPTVQGKRTTHFVGMWNDLGAEVVKIGIDKGAGVLKGVPSSVGCCAPDDDEESDEVEEEVGLPEFRTQNLGQANGRSSAMTMELGVHAN